jgi:hypothetical protein
VQYYWWSVILFSILSFPEFHTVVPLLQACCTSELLYDHACFCVFIFGSIFHIQEKTCSLCVSEPGLLHLTWCPPIASISLQASCHYSLWLRLHCVYGPHFLDPFISCRVISRAWLLSIVLWWTSCTGVSAVSCHTFFWVDAQERITGSHAVLSLVFWGISILLSIVVVLICIPTSRV